MRHTIKEVLLLLSVLAFLLVTSIAFGGEKVDRMLKTFVSVNDASGVIVKSWTTEEKEHWCWVLSASHVVGRPPMDGEPLRAVKGTFYIFDDDGRLRGSPTVPGVVEYQNSEIDFCICSFHIGGELKPAVLHPKRDYALFDEVFAVGRPNGEQPFASRGIVSSLNVSYQRKNKGFQLGHDAQLYYGSSGGPLFNSHGELIGINLGMGIDKVFGPVPGICYSLPLASIVQDLGQERTKKYFNLEVNPDELLIDRKPEPREPSGDSRENSVLGIEVEHHARTSGRSHSVAH